MPVQHAVLAVLSAEPSYGYEIRSVVEATLGEQWGQLNIGHVYQTLDRLVRDGQARASGPTRGKGADRVVYSITEAGRSALQEWLAAPAQRATGYRDEFFLKLLAAAWQNSAAVDGVITRQRRHLIDQLRTLSDLRANGSNDTLRNLLIASARLHTEADLQLLDLIEQEIPGALHDVQRSGSIPETLTQPRVESRK